MPLTAAELVEHPAYKNLSWKLPPAKSDYCTIAEGRRGGPFKLWYEVHGTGPKRMVVSPVLSLNPNLYFLLHYVCSFRGLTKGYL